MSLGRADDEEGDRQYVDAMEKGYVALGYGGDVDWSAEQFENFEAIKQRWRQDHPEATGNDPNIRQTYTVRAGMREGDLVVVSAGNLKFRAIGEIVGPYRYVVDEQGGYPHRRNVRWLWRDDAGQSYDEIYGKQFSQVSAYELVGSLINWNVLNEYIARGTSQPQVSSPEPWGKIGLVLNEPEGGHFLQRETLTPPVEGVDSRFRWIVRSSFPATCYDNLT